MSGHHSGPEQGSLSALLPGYNAPKLIFSAALIALLAVVWGLEGTLIETFGAGDFYFAEDFARMQLVITVFAGLLLAVMMIGEPLLMAGLLASMTVLTFIQVVLRYGFNTGLLWALEATTYMFAWLVLLGMSYGVRIGAHIGVDLVVKAFPDGLQRLVGAVAVSIAFAYALLMLWGAYSACEYLADLWRWLLDGRSCGYIDRLIILDVDAEDIPISRWLLTVMLPVGFALLAFRLFEVLVDVLRGRRTGFGLADEATEALDLQSTGKSFDGEAAR